MSVSVTMPTGRFPRGDLPLPTKVPVRPPVKVLAANAKERKKFDAVRPSAPPSELELSLGYLQAGAEPHGLRVDAERFIFLPTLRSQE